MNMQNEVFLDRDRVLKTSIHIKKKKDYSKSPQGRTTENAIKGVCLSKNQERIFKKFQEVDRAKPKNGNPIISED